ncbi:uncharacterized protein LOC130590142 [Beta vulgaris subsp. vulgaris]|uniref:uncharacterized protein LOC130590142 n=1 Tax=Beta vulgaris subsp. vulgaris TaxID=3555 RepID=UPI0025494C1A|nr:uncharacterized protein LOC130590142 [Beta vulgaris subsp. vulgaris]
MHGSGIYRGEKEEGSGCNVEDVLTEAREMWIEVHGPRFTLEHAWNVLKHYDKWTDGTQMSGGSSKRSGPDEGVSSIRPDGVKKVKSRRKAPSSTSPSPSSSEFTRRIRVGEDLLEYQKERDALRESTKEEDRKFKIWNILMAKSSLDPDEREMYKNLSYNLRTNMFS